MQQDAESESPATLMLEMAVFRGIMPSDAEYDDDTDSLVPVPKSSVPPHRSTAVALPEPDE
jgi:hypothetical protein